MRRALTTLVSTLAVAALAAGLLAAPRPQAEPFFFIQLSDPQLGFFTNDGPLEQDIANFEYAVANVNRLRPAFVVITGDLINKPMDPVQLAEYERIRGLLDDDIPLYELAGNHDVENAPTPASLEAYRARFGADRFTFRHGSLLGIALNSSVIHTPDEVPGELEEQDAWLREELAKARTSGARHVVVFQHHPWFLETAGEEDSYFNIPKVRREPLLAAMREAGVRTLVSGHFHQNAVAEDGGLEAVTTGAVGRPLGGSHSGFRIFVVTDEGITHRYVDFGQVPTTVDAARGLGPGRRGAPPPSGGRGAGTGR